MFSIPLRLAVGMLVMVAVPGLAAMIGHWHPTRRSSAQSTDDPSGGVGPATALPASSAPSLSIAPPPTARAPASSTTSGPAASNHARLILDGYFARRIGLLTALRELDVPGKTVRHAPQDHLLTALVNILAGHQQLQEISRGDNPLRGDLSLAEAWDQEQFPEVTGVCRQLHEADWAQAQAVRERLGQVFAPYIALCVGPTLARGQRLVVDWDLTPKQITTEAKSDPFAAYGHMEERLGKGYQWAEAVLRGTGPDGKARPAALGGFLCPGNAHPDGCLERLRLVTEAALGRPHRRPELLRIRLAGAQAQEQKRQGQVGANQAKLDAQEMRVQTWTSQLLAIEQRRPGRRSEQQALLARDERAKQTLEKRLAASQKWLEALRGRLAQADRILAEAKSLMTVVQLGPVVRRVRGTRS